MSRPIRVKHPSHHANGIPLNWPRRQSHLTSDRSFSQIQVVYLAAQPTNAFTSFAVPILNVEDSNVASPLFGAWYWLATVRPVPNGGVSTDHALVNVKISFHDGGGSAFYDKFVALKARLYHARELGASFATHAHLDQLPRYEPLPEGTGAQPSSLPAFANPSEIERPSPDGAPPDYEEAQAQAIAAELDIARREEV